MRNHTTLRRSLQLSIALAAGFAVYGLMTPAEAQAEHGKSSRGRVGYRSGATRVAAHHSRHSSYRHGRHSSYRHGHSSYYRPRCNNFHYDRVYHPEYYHWTPRHGLHTHGHYDLVPHYGNHHYGHGGHHRSGIHFSFGF